MLEIRARYDAAQTTEENARHWSAADNLSAGQSNAANIRRILRNRARYEVANNSYAAGMVTTLANDTIGRGPRLQIQTTDQAGNARLEEAWRNWTAEINLAQKLRTARRSVVIDGEAFFLAVTDRRLESPAKLNWILCPPEQVTAGAYQYQNFADGIELDRNGQPLRYWILDDHPTEFTGTPKAWKSSDVCHWMKHDRPGQLRGIPEITPALSLYAILRRYTLATLHSAEAVAAMTFFLKTMNTSGDADELTAGETIEINRNMINVLPRGNDLIMPKAEQPTTTYTGFKAAILEEIARCLNMPYNVAAGNSSSYNYASGRLDFQIYQRSIQVERHWIETNILRKLLGQFLEEMLFAGQLPADPRPFQAWPVAWFWDGSAHVDPVKEANAQAIRLANGTTTLADEWNAAGGDWEAKQEQYYKELANKKRLMQKYGLTQNDIDHLKTAAETGNRNDDDEEGLTPAQTKQQTSGA